MFIERSAIVWDRFAGLENCEEKWRDDQPYWESFNEAFFLSNGLPYERARDSNVESWLTARDRAPFTNITAELLPRLARSHDLTGVDLVILAHWLPDLHLGSSVTNYAMHFIGLEQARGFAISDRGTSAPFFALDLIGKCMDNGRVDKALLLVMDQKHLLYRSATIDALKPQNSGLAMLLTRTGTGSLGFCGYRRRCVARQGDLAETARQMAAEVGIELEEAQLIAETDTLVRISGGRRRIAAEPSMVCAAPFCELARHIDSPGPFLLACLNDDELTVVGFEHEGVRRAP